MMKSSHSLVVVVIYVTMWYHIHGLSIAKKIPFTFDMLPILANFTIVNSKNIEVFWQPSPFIHGIDISQLDGAFSAGAYIGRREDYGGQICSVYHMHWINSTGWDGNEHCAPNTVYEVCFQSQWRPQDDFACIYADVPFRRICQLVRTYAEGK